MDNEYKNKIPNGEKFTLASLTKERGAGAVYSAAAILPTLLSLIFLIAVSALGLVKEDNSHADADWFLYASYLITPVAFALIGAVFFTRGKVGFRSVVGTCNSKYYLLALLFQFGLFSLSSLNGLFLELLERAFGYVSDEIVLPSLNGGGIVGVIVVVALLPAVFEELIFRGFLLRGLKGFGETFAVLVCGALFALYHKNPAQTVYQFICGVAFALVAIRSGSILPTVISHFINNAVIIVLYRLGLSDIPQPWGGIAIGVSAVCLVLAILWIFLFDRKKEEDKTEEQPSKKAFFLFAAAGIAICAVTWMSGFFPAG
ncbi:MAG: CPBP family intramembrane metalloprotease [Clostridia bacterium]|nr:CPBP family intramembrane metalloprotease [Clostridia bacterium]